MAKNEEAKVIRKIDMEERPDKVNINLNNPRSQTNLLENNIQKLNGRKCF